MASSPEQLSGTGAMRIRTVRLRTPTTGSSASSSLSSTTPGHHLWQMQGAISTILESSVKSLEASSLMTSPVTLEGLLWVTGGTGLGMGPMIVSAGLAGLEGGEKVSEPSLALTACPSPARGTQPSLCHCRGQGQAFTTRRQLGAVQVVVVVAGALGMG